MMLYVCRLFRGRAYILFLYMKKLHFTSMQPEAYIKKAENGGVLQGVMLQ